MGLDGGDEAGLDADGKDGVEEAGDAGGAGGAGGCWAWASLTAISNVRLSRWQPASSATATQAAASSGRRERRATFMAYFLGATLSACAISRWWRSPGSVFSAQALTSGSLAFLAASSKSLMVSWWAFTPKLLA